MAIDWQKRWAALNKRQQTYLKIIYDLDYEKEQYYRHRWNPQRQGYPPPASQWRWIPYDGGLGGFRDTPLGQRLRSEQLVDRGTGSTFESLEEHGLIERKYEQHEDEAVLFVQMTRAGRTLIRQNLDVPQPPPKLAKGQLRERHWRALSIAYEAAGDGLISEDGAYGGITWNTWLRLRDYRPPLIRQAHSVPSGYMIFITQEGIDYYEEQWATYCALYPDVAAEKPATKKVSLVVKTGGTPYDLVKLGNAIRDKRGDRGYREIGEEVDLAPSLLSRLENAKPTTSEIYDTIFSWLDTSADDFLSISN